LLLLLLLTIELLVTIPLVTMKSSSNKSEAGGTDDRQMKRSKLTHHPLHAAGPNKPTTGSDALSKARSVAPGAAPSSSTSSTSIRRPLASTSSTRHLPSLHPHARAPARSPLESILQSDADVSPSTFDYGPFSLSELSHSLRCHFGLDRLRVAQCAAISSVLRRRDCMAVLPTGHGKSLTYQLPAVAWARRRPGNIVIVVQPLVSLMKDQVSSLRARGIPAALLGASVDAKEKQAAYADLRKPAEPVEQSSQPSPSSGPPPPLTRLCLLYCSPELLCSSHGREIVAELAQQERLKLVAIDEFHCISQWGHQFRRDYLALSFIRKGNIQPNHTHSAASSPSSSSSSSASSDTITAPVASSVPLLLLSATATRRVSADVRHILGLDSASMDFIRLSANRPNLAFSVIHKETIKTMEGEEMNVFKHMARMIRGWMGKQEQGQKSTETATVGSNIKHHETPPFTPSSTLAVTASSATVASATAAASSSSATVTPASKPIAGNGIIYCWRKDTCSVVANELRKLNISAIAYHAGLSQSDRTRAQKEWQENRVDVICATVAFGMGINKEVRQHWTIHCMNGVGGMRDDDDDAFTNAICCSSVLLS